MIFPGRSFVRNVKVAPVLWRPSAGVAPFTVRTCLSISFSDKNIQIPAAFLLAYDKCLGRGLVKARDCCSVVISGVFCFVASKCCRAFYFAGDEHSWANLEPRTRVYDFFSDFFWKFGCLWCDLRYNLRFSGFKFWLLVWDRRNGFTFLFFDDFSVRKFFRSRSLFFKVKFKLKIFLFFKIIWFNFWDRTKIVIKKFHFSCYSKNAYCSPFLFMSGFPQRQNLTILY